MNHILVSRPPETSLTDSESNPALLSWVASKETLVDAISPVARSQWGTLATSAQLALPPNRTEFDKFRHQMANFFSPNSVENAVLGEAAKTSRPVRAPKLASRSHGLGQAGAKA